MDNISDLILLLNFHVCQPFFNVSLGQIPSDSAPTYSIHLFILVEKVQIERVKIFQIPVKQMYL